MPENKADSNKDGKGDKIGPDGLTKKQRRALKVTKKEGTPKPQTQHPPPTSSRTTGTHLQPLQNATAAVPTPVLAETKTPSTAMPPVSAASTKTQLRTERRALQEKQRIEKQLKIPAKDVDKPTSTPSEKVVLSNKVKTVSAKKATALQDSKATLSSQPKTSSSKRTANTLHQVHLFNHLYAPKSDNKLDSKVVVLKHIHPVFVRLGVQYQTKTIIGSNARCLALLSALKQFIETFEGPTDQEFYRALENDLQVCVDHLQSCRKFAVSMTNALRHFKMFLTKELSDDMSALDDIEKRERLLTEVNRYIDDDITKASLAISMSIVPKIKADDCIVTYGASSLIRRILIAAHEQAVAFRVIVLDAHPLFEGREMLRALTSVGIRCTYALINAGCSIMGSATKVLLGAHALLANGSVMARTGTAQVAMIAKHLNKPVLVCCETYKFCERTQTDSYVYNELANPDLLAETDNLEEPSPLVKWRNYDTLTPLHIMYDVTPPDYVTAMVTELGWLPCTSVPVILRVKQTDVV